MNLIDLLVLIILGFFVVISMYRGFLHSVLKGAADLVSWVAALILHPLLSMIVGSRGTIAFLSNYVEGATKLADAASISRVVAEVPQEELIQIVDTSSLVSPFGRLVRGNLLHLSFEGRGLTTVGEYFDETVAQVALHILCFLLLFVVIRLALGIYINIVDYKRPFPVLVRYENSFSAIAGLVRGLLFCYVLFTMMPIILSVFDVKLIVDYINSSLLGSFFYKTNLFLLLVGGA